MRTALAFGTCLILLGCGSSAAPARDFQAELPAGQAWAAAWIAEPRPAFLDFAVAHHLALTAIFHWTGERTADIDAWLDFFQQADQRGIPLRISPLPDFPDQSAACYLAARDAQRSLDRVWDFVALYQSEGLPPATLVLDVEGRDPGKLAAAVIPFAALGNEADRDLLVAEALPPKAHAAAVALYQAFVDRAHAAGWKVGVTSLPLLADDGCDGANLERALGTPVTGVGWDLVTLQAYRTLMYPVVQSLGFPMPTGYYVYKVAKRVHDRFGDKGGVDIGLMSVNFLQGSEDDYQSFAEWGEDLAGARAAGIAPGLVVPFRLELAFDSKDPADPAAWLVDVPETPAPPDSDQITDAILQVWCLADTKLGPLLPTD